MAAARCTPRERPQVDPSRIRTSGHAVRTDRAPGRVSEYPGRPALACATRDPGTMAGSTAAERRTVAVSGSASGIGRALRECLERNGQRVIGVDVRDAEVT